MEERTSISHDLKMHPNGRNKALMVVVVDKFSNHLCLMTMRIVKSVRSKWEITKLQFKKQGKEH